MSKSTPSIKKLCIIAGGGALPGALMAHCVAQKIPFCVIALKGQADGKLLPPSIALNWLRLGAVGRGFSLLKKNDVSDIVFVGAVRRPSMAQLCPDMAGMSFFAKAGRLFLGDDDLLRGVIHLVEQKGYNVLGIHEIMPQLLAPVGILGKYQPDKNDDIDIKRGYDVAKALGKQDVGQAVIVQEGIVLSVEGIEGTKALIQRSTSLKRPGNAGVLVKVAKPNQERRIDLPTIGPDTVQDVHAAGFKGIAIESGSVLMVEIEKVIELADKLGIFIIGVGHGN